MKKQLIFSALLLPVVLLGLFLPRIALYFTDRSDLQPEYVEQETRTLKQDATISGLRLSEKYALLEAGAYTVKLSEPLSVKAEQIASTAGQTFLETLLEVDFAINDVQVTSELVFTGDTSFRIQTVQLELSGGIRADFMFDDETNVLLSLLIRDPIGNFSEYFPQAALQDATGADSFDKLLGKKLADCIALQHIDALSQAVSSQYEHENRFLLLTLPEETVTAKLLVWADDGIISYNPSNAHMQEINSALVADEAE